MLTKKFVSGSTFVAWSNALDQFEDNFIAICDYRPLDSLAIDIKCALREECRDLFDSMEDEIGSLEKADISLFTFVEKNKLEQKLMDYTNALITLNNKIEKFLYNRIAIENESPVRTSLSFPVFELN